MATREADNSASQILNSKEKQKNSNRLASAIIFAVLWIFLGLFNFSVRQYVVGTVYIGGAMSFLVFAYVYKKYHPQIRPRIGYGVLLIGVGVLFLFFNDTSNFFFGGIALAIAGLSGAGPIAIYGIGGGLACVFCTYWSCTLKRRR